MFFQSAITLTCPVHNLSNLEGIWDILQVMIESDSEATKVYLTLFKATVPTNSTAKDVNAT